MAKKEVPVMTLDQWRTRRMLTTRALSAAAGVTTQTLLNAKHGRGTRFGTMRKIAAALGVEPRQVAEFARVLEGGGDGVVG